MEQDGLERSRPAVVKAGLLLRAEELRRRVMALPEEVKRWERRTEGEGDLDMSLHFSQLQALHVMMSAYFEQQRTLVTSLSASSQFDVFAANALSLVTSIINSQRVWNFFRSKLDLRFSPEFKDVLRTADIIAADCYRPVMDEAVARSIVKQSKVREPPLTYLVAEFSAATWVRKSRPNDGRKHDLGEAELPIPVIEVPWDHVRNVWEFLSLHHEVGHDIEADLGLRDPLQITLRNALAENRNIPADRIQQWAAWQAEALADFIGLQLAGPAYTEMLANLLILPPTMVMTIDRSDPHPNHYIRILLNVAYIRSMADGDGDANFSKRLRSHAQSIEDFWIGLYGQDPQLQSYADNFTIVIQALMDSKHAQLKGASLRELIPYTMGDDQKIRAIANFLVTGKDSPGSDIRPRHAVSGARIAATEVLRSGLPALTLDSIDRQTAELVNKNRPRGLLAGGQYPAARAAEVKRFVETVDLGTVLAPES
jgi:hypothetical protein